MYWDSCRQIVFRGWMLIMRVRGSKYHYLYSFSNLDNMIGRAAHISFLENHALIKLIIYSFEDLFE